MILTGASTTSILATVLHSGPPSVRKLPVPWVPGLAAVVLLGLILLAYVPFLDTGFAATDSLPLVETSRFSTFAEALRLFDGPVMAGTRFAVGEVVYRPFVSLSLGSTT